MARRRAAFAALSLALVSGLLTPPDVSAREVLEGPEAGFHHARFDRVPIIVERARWVAAGMRYWNDRAGWRLFTFGDTPEITLHHRAPSGCNLCAFIIEPKDGWKQPYQKCGIAVAKAYRDRRSDVAHELGHCLGLRHQRKGAMSSGRLSPRFDRKLLKAAGYYGA